MCLNCSVGGLLPGLLVQAAAAGRMTHCDKVGDPVCMEEARWVLNVVYDALAGQVGGDPVVTPCFCTLHSSSRTDSMLP